MDFTAYYRQAKRTAIYKKRMTFAYLIPGAADEALELMDARSDSDSELDEAGDALWMSVMLRAALSLPLVIEPFTSGCHLRDHLDAPARDLIHRWTKIARDRDGVPDQEDRILIDEATTKIVRLVMYLMERRGIAIEALIELNIAKLAGRQQRGTLAGSGVR